MLTRIITLASVVCGITVSIPAMAASKPPVLDPTRTVVIEGAIGKGNVLQLIGPMLGMAAADRTRPVDIVISSPGGDIVTGFMFLNGMEQVRAEGVRLRCFVPTMAASMAFQILLHCDERYTLDHSFLLWHGVRIMADWPITAAGAADLARSLAKSDEVIVSELLGTLGRYMSAQDIMYHFGQETLHVGEQLALMAPGFIVSYKSIPGLMEVMLNPQVLHAAKIKLKTDLDSEYETSISGNPSAQIMSTTPGKNGPDPLPVGPLREKRDASCRASFPTQFEECRAGMNSCVLQLMQDKDKEKFLQCTVLLFRKLGGN